MVARPSNGPEVEGGGGVVDGQSTEGGGEEMSAVAAGCRSRVKGFVVRDSEMKKQNMRLSRVFITP